MELTTLCYIEKNDSFLMLHRIKKKHDINKDKWIGVGGHLERDESPEECIIREIYEETGLEVFKLCCRGIITFICGSENEYIFLYTARTFSEPAIDCNEGTLEWIPKTELMSLSLWEGDRIFLKLLSETSEFFSLKLCYDGDRLTKAILNGNPLELLDIIDENGKPAGLTRERSLAHLLGTPHHTAHVWIVRPCTDGYEILLQKRSHNKDSYPDCYDISSAGHVPAGSSCIESAIRELKEELGICASCEDLVLIGTHKGVSQNIFYGKPFINHEISPVYIYRKQIDISSLKLQEEEIQSVKWINLYECINDVKSNKPGYCLFLDELEMLESYLLKDDAH